MKLKLKTIIKKFWLFYKINSRTNFQALWSCYGENRPKASWYPLLIYVFLEEGVFLYEASQHTITNIFDGDYRYLAGAQTDVVTKARANFVLIGDLKKNHLWVMMRHIN